MANATAILTVFRYSFAGTVCLVYRYRDRLSEEWFYNRTNPAQGGEGNNPTRPVSVLYGSQSDPWLRLNTAKLDLDSYDPDQQAALIEIRDHLESRRLELALGMGQIA